MGKTKGERRSMVIFKQWIINGRFCELGSWADFASVAKLVMDALDVQDRVLVLSVQALQPNRDQPRQAELKLVMLDEARSFIEDGKTCCLIPSKMTAPKVPA